MAEVIAIDGPAASGKSSVAARVARRLAIPCVNTGAMYRALTWRLLELCGDLENANEISAALDQIEIETKLTGEESTILIDGKDPAPHLASDAVNSGVSTVAKLPEVRRRLVAEQRRLGEARPVVMEGRDIGSVVFPQTPYKFYIDAHPEVRQQRRAAQGLHDAIDQRDRVDQARSESPLVIAPDAVVIDSSDMTLDEVVEEVLRGLKKKNFPACK